MFSVRYCDNCTSNEVCLANDLQFEKIPTCHRIKYAKDPTGCGGHCELGKQICRRLGHGAFRYSKLITIIYDNSFNYISSV